MTNIPIIFENESVVVIDKPAGILVHTDGQSTDQTVVDWFLNHCPDSRGVGESASLPDGLPLERSGVVHRLDRETSGVMILVKTDDAYRCLKEEFRARRVYKEYHTIVYGWMKEKRGNINRPIGRSRRDSRCRSAQRGAAGKLRSATTDWELLKQGTYGPEAEHFAYLKLIPQTGRTHQLRAHLKAIDRPIVGDGLYAPAALRAGSNLDLDRLALHAHCLELSLPHSGKHEFVSPLPAMLTDAVLRIAE